MYLEGYGALFMLNASFPLKSAPSPKEEKVEQPEDTEWERTRRELHDKVAHWLAGLTGVHASDFLGISSDGRHHIFEVVAAPAFGTCNHVMVLRISRAFDVYATLAAKNRYGLVSH